MIRFVLATLLLPLAFATQIPLPSRRPKGVPAPVYAQMLKMAKGVKQFDLGKMGIPVEPSLRLVSGDDEPTASTMVAISPKSMKAMAAWYEKHLHGWKVLSVAKGFQVTLAPKGATMRDVMSHTRPSLLVAICRRGKWSIFSCGSIVTIYEPKAHPGH